MKLNRKLRKLPIFCFIITAYIICFSTFRKSLLSFLSTPSNDNIPLADDTNLESAPYAPDYDERIPEFEAPTRPVYYLKVQKTGGTTFRKILQRHSIQFPYIRLPLLSSQDIGHIDDLSRFLVPGDSLLKYLEEHPDVTEDTGISWDDKWREIKGHIQEDCEKENQCDLIENHTSFNKTVIQRIMTGDIMYLATIREPVSHLKSVNNYFLYYNIWNITSSNPFETYARNPELYDKNGGATRNFMARKFGLKNNENDSGYVSEFITTLNNTFDVIINERFDESLVLLRRKYKWELRNLLYMKFYQRKYVDKYQALDPVLVDNLRQWSNVDFALYDTFYQRQINMERQYGIPELIEEVKLLRALNRQLFGFCMTFCDERGRQMRVSRHNPVRTVFEELGNSKMTFEETKYNRAFDIDYYDCAFLTVHEKMAHWLFHLRQRPLLCRHWDTLAKLKTFEAFPVHPADMNMTDVKFMCDPDRDNKFNLSRSIPLSYFQGCDTQRL